LCDYFQCSLQGCPRSWSSISLLTTLRFSS
jgi:hypothetical protein